MMEIEYCSVFKTATSFSPAFPFSFFFHLSFSSVTYLPPRKDTETSLTTTCTAVEKKGSEKVQVTVEGYDGA